MTNKNYGRVTGGRIMEAYYDYPHLTNLVYEALDYGMESIQVFPNQVRRAKELLDGRPDAPAVCAVIAYPHGTFLPEQKAYEIEDAVQEGADQLEVVLNVVNVRSGDWAQVEREFALCRQAAGARTLKFIVEAEYLKPEMLKRVCGLAAAAGIDRLCTSIGVYPIAKDGAEAAAGAEAEDVRLMKEYSGGKMKTVAMGCIDSPERFMELLNAGADYICTEFAAQILKKL